MLYEVITLVANTDQQFEQLARHRRANLLAVAGIGLDMARLVGLDRQSYNFV